MSENKSRQIRKEMNQLYGNVNEYSRTYAMRVLFRGRLF